jgi:hypothetical protein
VPCFRGVNICCTSSLHSSPLPVPMVDMGKPVFQALFVRQRWRDSNRCMQKHAWSRQTMAVLPKMHFSTSIQHVISTKTGAGIDSLKLAWLTHNKHWYSSTPFVMHAKSKTCVLVHWF